MFTIVSSPTTRNWNAGNTLPYKGIVLDFNLDTPDACVIRGIVPATAKKKSTWTSNALIHSVAVKIDRA